MLKWSNTEVFKYILFLCISMYVRVFFYSPIWNFVHSLCFILTIRSINLFLKNIPSFFFKKKNISQVERPFEMHALSLCLKIVEELLWVSYYGTCPKLVTRGIFNSLTSKTDLVPEYSDTYLNLTTGIFKVPQKNDRKNGLYKQAELDIEYMQNVFDEKPQERFSKKFWERRKPVRIIFDDVAKTEEKIKKFIKNLNQLKV